MRWAALWYLRLVHALGREGCYRARCVECGIWFLTRRCNHRHKNLCCPFGCREIRALRLSGRRCRDYYRSPEGKQKKQDLNRKRDRRKKPLGESVVTPLPAPSPAVQFPSKSLIRHAVFIVLLAKVTVSLGEVGEVLQMSHAIWRQLSLASFEDFCDTDFRGEEKRRWPP